MKSNWEQIKLADLFELQMGKTPAREKDQYWKNGNNKWISIADISKFSRYTEETKEKITDIAISESGIKQVPANTLIMSFKLSLGKVAITSEPIYTNEAIMAFIDLKKRQFSLAFLFHLFKNKDWSAGTNKAVLGMTLNKTTLKDISIPAPPLPEQEEIAQKLDTVCRLITLREQQLQKLDQLASSRFIEMFGDLAAPHCKWQKEMLIDSCPNSDDIKCGPFGTQLNKEEYRNSGVAVWEIPQINSGFMTSPTHYLTAEKASQLEAYSLIPGDIAMSRKGNVGKCAIFPAYFQPGIIHSDVLRIRLDQRRVSPVFMMYQLHISGAVQHQIELVSSGAIMAGINVTKLKKIYVHLPPLELQNEFAAFIEQLDKSKVIGEKQGFMLEKITCHDIL